MEKNIKEFTVAFSPHGVDGRDDCIIVWPWEQAPMPVRQMSENGGDEDGAVWIPRKVQEPWWLEKLWAHYGEPDRYQFSDGMLVIWAHS